MIINITYNLTKENIILMLCAFNLLYNIGVFFMFKYYIEELQKNGNKKK